MQRINYFTNPNFTGPFADVNISGEVKASYNADTYDKAVGGLPGFFSGDTMPRA